MSEDDETCLYCRCDITRGQAVNPEPEGYEFGYHAFEDMEPIKSDIQEIKVSIEREPVTLPPEEIKLPLSDEKLLALQAKDKFCNDISN